MTPKNDNEGNVFKIVCLYSSPATDKWNAEVLDTLLCSFPQNEYIG